MERFSTSRPTELVTAVGPTWRDDWRVKSQTIDPGSVPPAEGGYTQGMRVSGVTDLLLISGQVPETSDGVIPDDFESQCRQAWANVISVLSAAELTIANLLKVTTYLSDRRYAGANSRVRREVLGEHRPALTVVITGTYDERWLLEIEALAGA
jgi:2-iminobutanoate/2-iminopropanoate deaminase